jgi:hypothetical protein
MSEADLLRTGQNRTGTGIDRLAEDELLRGVEVPDEPTSIDRRLAKLKRKLGGEP